MGSWQVAENTSEGRRFTEFEVCCYVFLYKEKFFFLNSLGRNGTAWSLKPECHFLIATGMVCACRNILQ